MRDGDNRLALHQRVQAGLDCSFHLGVQGAGSLVKQQDRCILEHHPGDCDALALTTRKFDPALAHMRVVRLAAVRIDQRGNEPVCLGTSCGFHHVLFAGVGPSITYVVAH